MLATPVAIAQSVAAAALAGGVELLGAVGVSAAAASIDYFDEEVRSEFRARNNRAPFGVREAKKGQRAERGYGAKHCRGLWTGRRAGPGMWGAFFVAGKR